MRTRLTIFICVLMGVVVTLAIGYSSAQQNATGGACPAFVELAMSELEDHGGRRAATPRAMAEEADFILTSLPSAEAGRRSQPPVSITLAHSISARVGTCVSDSVRAPAPPTEAIGCSARPGDAPGTVCSPQRFRRRHRR